MNSILSIFGGATLEERLRKIVWGTQEIDIIPVQEFLEKLWNHEIL